MLTKVLFCVALLSIVHHSSCKTISELKREVLDQILPKNENDVMVAPGNLTSDFTTVEATMYILNIDEINEVKKEITLRMYFRQYWNDHRLKYIANSQFPFVSISNEEAIWTPDVFFVNEKKSRTFDTLRPNVMIRIFPDGNVVHSKKVSVTLNCPMDFTKYPFDIQKCNLHIESYSNSAENFMLKWKQPNPVGIYSKNPVKNLNLEKMGSSYGMLHLHTTNKNYSFLDVDFYFSRNLDTSIYLIYLPSFAMLILSLLPFWINKKMISSRLLLSLGALLSYFLILYRFNEEQPQAQNSKTMLCFTGTNVSFLVLSTLVTVLVHYFDKDKHNSKLVENGDLNETNIKAVRLKSMIKKLSGKMSHVDICARFIIPFMYVAFCVIYFAAAGAFATNEAIPISDK